MDPITFEQWKQDLFNRRSHDDKELRLIATGFCRKCDIPETNEKAIKMFMLMVDTINHFEDELRGR